MNPETKLLEAANRLDKARLNPTMVKRIIEAADDQPAVVMTPEEFREWLAQQ